MTVQELIDRLKDCDPEGIVLVWNLGAGGAVEVTDVDVDQENGTVLIEGTEDD